MAGKHATSTLKPTQLKGWMSYTTFQNGYRVCIS
jgi:hypothetical protein